jgi:hypothetical protein
MKDINKQTRLWTLIPNPSSAGPGIWRLKARRHSPQTWTSERCFCEWMGLSVPWRRAHYRSSPSQNSNNLPIIPTPRTQLGNTGFLRLRPGKRERSLVQLLTGYWGNSGTTAQERKCSVPGETSLNLEPPEIRWKDSWTQKASSQSSRGEPLEKGQITLEIQKKK